MLLWIDLETTGLDPQGDYIVEVAWMTSYDDLTARSNTHSYVVDLSPAARKQLMENPYVLDMHKTSGLLDALDASPGNFFRIEDIEDDIIAAIKRETVSGDRISVAGFSVHFDLSFINEHMPRLAELLSHRVYDVSTLRTFFREINIESSYENENKHRAGDDVIESYYVALEYQRVTQFAFKKANDKMSYESAVRGMEI
jgi:oligoribonuclease